MGTVATPCRQQMPWKLPCICPAAPPCFKGRRAPSDAGLGAAAACRGADCTAADPGPKHHGTRPCNSSPSPPARTWRTSSCWKCSAARMMASVAASSPSSPSATRLAQAQTVSAPGRLPIMLGLMYLRDRAGQGGGGWEAG